MPSSVNNDLGSSRGYKNDQDEKSRSGFAAFCQMGKFFLFFFNLNYRVILLHRLFDYYMLSTFIILLYPLLHFVPLYILFVSLCL